ncbi:beta-lactamase family protein [bacterium]|nr:beta-lactamase family protein [bacterium]
MLRTPHTAFLFLVLATLALAGCARDKPLRANPASLGFVPDTNVGLDVLLNQAVRDGSVPGAVLSVARDGRILYERAVGYRDPSGKHPLPMTRATLFDVASLTKPVATAPATLLLNCHQHLSLTDPAGPFTPRELLLHTSGLNAYIDWRDLQALGKGSSPAESILAASVNAREIPDGRGYFAYSNLGYVILASVDEDAAGESLESFLRRELWDPLGMTHTTFYPPTPTKENRIVFARTSDDQQPGRPFDPLADYILSVYENRCPGHSGLFSTAGDLTIYCQALLQPRTFHVESLDCLSKQLISNPVDLGSWDGEGALVLSTGKVRRTLGFAIDPRVEGDAALFHTGYTGTAIWLNRETGVSVVLLTNAVYTGDDRWQTLMREVIALVQRNTL